VTQRQYVSTFTTLLVVVMSADWHAGHADGDAVDSPAWCPPLLCSSRIRSFCASQTLDSRSARSSPDGLGTEESAAVSYLESHATQGREEFLFDHLFQMVDAVRSSLKLTTGTVMVSRPQHLEAVAHPGDCRFNRAACIERLPQFTRGATHVAVGVSQEVYRQALDTAQDRLDSCKVPVHVTPAFRLQRRQGGPAASELTREARDVRAENGLECEKEP
jgi:hypothetical protein